MKKVRIHSPLAGYLGFIYILALSLVTGNIYAQSQAWTTFSDPSINVISRSERGADNSRLLYENKLYASIKKKLGLDKPKTYSPIIKTKTNAQIADDYLLANFPDEYKTDGYLTQVDNKDLFWPITTKSNKTKIIIHHTAGELDEGASGADVLNNLIGIYRYHTFTRGRGDIGYNFLIGPQGQIYEGRAGGIDAVGANASYNNSDSVGISVMGNFNLAAPSPEQYMGLLRLVIAAVKKYNIKVYDTKTYHKASSIYPYVSDVQNYGIIGHTDAGNTSCPGKYLYEDLDYIRFAADHGIGDYEIMDATQYVLSSQSQNIPLNIKYLNRYNSNFTARIAGSKNLKCESADTKISANCDINGDTINMNITNNGYDLNNSYNVKITNDRGENFNIYIRLLGYSDLQSQISKIQNIYTSKFGKPNSPATYAKIDNKISATTAAQFLNQSIGVMLYELSTDYNSYNIKCLGGCSVDIYNDGVKTTFDKMTIFDFDTKSLDKINFYTNEQTYPADKIYINPTTATQFTNYKRNSSSKTPRNIFSGQIIVEKQNIRKLDGKRYNARTIINTLPLHDYIAGIAESNDSEPYEKVKLMTILSKQYALYYMGKNKHDYISADSDFVLTDDPRISQKYVGYGFISKKRKQALDETRSQAVIYDGYLPILPYFSCSAGFTRGAEKFGRTDTPYLKSKLDPWGYCSDGKGNFAGHGVGLAGNGAAAMAKKGYDYKQILEYYYDGTRIQDLSQDQTQTITLNNGKKDETKTPTKTVNIQSDNTNNIKTGSTNTGNIKNNLTGSITGTNKLSTAISRGYKNGLTIYNTQKNFLPNTYISREQTAKMIIKFSELLDKKNNSFSDKCIFADSKSFNESLASYIYMSCSNGIFNGYTKDKQLVFGYDDKLSYGQALAIIIRITDGKQSEKGSKRYQAYIDINSKKGYINISKIKDRNKYISRGEFITWLYDTSNIYN